MKIPVKVVHRPEPRCKACGRTCSLVIRGRQWRVHANHFWGDTGWRAAEDRILKEHFEGGP